MLIGTAVAQTEAPAEDDKTWTRGGQAGINLSQVELYNWSKGGESSTAAVFNAQAFMNYKDGRHIWDNNFYMDLGFLKLGGINGKDSELKKTDDRLELNSKYGYGFKKTDKWYYSALFNFKTQLIEGFDYSVTPYNYISNFMAPAYIKLALGIDYKPNKAFTAFMSPMTGNIIYVNDQNLANAGAFGVEPAEVDANGVIVKDASLMRMQLGGYVRFAYQKDIWENVNLATKLELFSDYLKQPENIDVDWEVIVNMKINSYLNAQIKSHLIYDHDVKFDIDSNGDGVGDYKAPRMQFKETIGIGILYQF
jgi:hypothetical protein